MKLLTCLGVIVAAVLVLIGYQPLAMAENWKLFYETESQKFYYDNDSIQKPSQNVIKVAHKVTEKGADANEVDKAKRVVEVNCKERSFRILSNVEYDIATGTEITAQQFQGGQYRTDLYSGTMQGLIENLCPPAKW
jgi:hypothetical protein